MATKQTENRVWIELEKPRDAAHANEICGLANNLLQRISPGTAKQFSYSSRNHKFLYGDLHGCVTLADRGEWLNLDFVGRPLDVPADKWVRAAA